MNIQSRENNFLQEIFCLLYKDGIELKSSHMGSHAQSRIKPGSHRHHIYLLDQFHQCLVYIFLKANQILHEPYFGIQPMAAETQWHQTHSRIPKHRIIFGGIKVRSTFSIWISPINTEHAVFRSLDIGISQQWKDKYECWHPDQKQVFWGEKLLCKL